MAPIRPVDTSSLHVGIRRIVEDQQLASHLEREELLFHEILMRFIICLVILAAAVIGEKAAAANPSCTFVAQGEDVDLKVLVDKQTCWEGHLRKGERQTLRVPEGAFTVQSQVYIPEHENQKNYHGPQAYRIVRVRASDSRSLVYGIDASRSQGKNLGRE